MKLLKNIGKIILAIIGCLLVGFSIPIPKVPSIISPMIDLIILFPLGITAISVSYFLIFINKD